MTVKTLLLIQAEVIVVAAVIGLFIWRYWWEPRQEEPLLKPAPAAVAGTAGTPVATPAPVAKPVTPAVSPPAPTGAVKPVLPAPTPKPVVPPPPTPVNLVRNGDFARGLEGWSYWKDGRGMTNLITIVRQVDANRTTHILRIENPDKRMIGVQQPVSLVSGAVYRLSAKVRSTATVNKAIIFGGRVAVYLPPQPEHSITWVTENTNWWTRTLDITNTVTGVGAVYVHMGYGNVASTGEFTAVSLERVWP